MLSTRSTLGLALLLVLTGAVAPRLQAQISVKATPYSFRTNLVEDVPSYTLHRDPTKKPVPQLYREEEAGFFIIPPAKPGLDIPVDLGFDNAGQWTLLPDGGRLWQMRITSAGASSLHLVYGDFWMPPGAQLFLYNDDRSVVLGAFTQQNNKAHGGFATDFVPDQATTLEYYEPAGAEPGRLHIAMAMHGTLGAAGAAKGNSAMDYTPTSLPCSINVACSEGDGWDDAINATVKISNGCTGVLLNNTREDQTPYVLTANHCGSPSVGDTLNWVFQFNYQSDTCADPAETPSYQSVSGAVVRAANSSSFSDFTLMELLEPIPASYNVYLAGWSIEGVAPPMGAVIGHPEQDIKKLAFDDDNIRDRSIAYWEADIDRGVIEDGSSGSPLFNDSYQFIGHVRAAQEMDPDACSGPGGDDNAALVIFPKLSYSWNVGSPGQRLSDFLDPDGTGSTNVSPLPGSGMGTPASIWINEIEADTGTASTEDDEFIEIVGVPGTDLTNYTFDIYTCSGGSATLLSTQTISSITLQNNYEEFGIYVIGGPALDSAVRDQIFAGSGTNVLPDEYGLIVLKNAVGTEIFDYQYDTQTAGIPNHCPSNWTTRSIGDPEGVGTMGFTVANPTDSDFAWAGLMSSPGAQNSDGGQLLPVELVSFDALLDGSAMLLRWKTASETNNAGFEIQSASTNEGARHIAPVWDVLGWVEGHGTTLETQSYQYRTENLAPGRYRFRLKQIDFDGAFDYSPEVEVAVDVPGTYHLSAAYPNPFNPQTQFSLSVARGQQVQVSVYDVVGRRVALLYEGLMESGSTRAFVFEPGSLPSGLYLIRAVGERFLATQPVTLLK